MADELTLAERVRAVLDLAEENAHRIHWWDCDALMGVGGEYGTCNCPEPDQRRRMVAAHRTILAIHRSYDEEYPDHADPNDPDRTCVGCGFDNQEERMVTDVSRCPIVVALAQAYDVAA